MKIESFDHIHIYSKDPEEASKFYKQHFKGKEIYRKVSDDRLQIFLLLGSQTIVFGPLPDNRMRSKLGNPEHSQHMHQKGLDHFGLRVKDLDKALRELKEAGVKILAEPVSSSSGINYAFAAGPDGVVIELTQYGLLAKIYLKFKQLF